MQSGVNVFEIDATWSVISSFFYSNNLFAPELMGLFAEGLELPRLGVLSLDMESSDDGSDLKCRYLVSKSTLSYSSRRHLTLFRQHVHKERPG